MPGARRKVAKGRVYWCPDRWSPSIWSGTPEEEAAQLHEIARLLAGARDHRPAQGTIARAVAEFMGDEKWRGYSDGTQRNWLPHLEWLRDELGWMSGAEFAAAGKQILAHHAALAKRAPRTADMFLQATSRFSTWASAPARELLPINTNPTKGIDKAFRAAPQRAPSLEDVRAAEAKLRPTHPHLADALVLALNTGLRRGDLCTLDWQAVEGAQGRIVWRPSKSRWKGRIVIIPIKAELATLLARLPREDGPILRNLWGDPWTPDGLSSSLWKALDVDWSLHDLRRACATHLAAQGWNSRQMARVLGWSEADAEAMSATYVDETRTTGGQQGAKPPKGKGKKPKPANGLRV
jgi:integrase